MAILKYSNGFDPLFGKRGGQCFQNSSRGNVFKNNAHMRQFRTPPQHADSIKFIRGTSNWRFLGSSVNTNWQNFVDFLPQPQKRDPLLSLTAYENFVKRNFYLQLSNQNSNLFMLDPALVEYQKDTLSVLCNVGSDFISLDCQFVNQDSSLDCLLFLSGIQSAGKTYIETVWRYMAVIDNSNQSVDITVRYLGNFGLIPPIGSKLFFSVVFCGHDNGQFWFPEKTGLISSGEVFADPLIFGYLYKHSVCSSSLISTSGWRIPSWLDILATAIYIDPAHPVLSENNNESAGYLKESGTVNWYPPNETISNFFEWLGRGAGGRDELGIFFAFKWNLNVWNSEIDEVSGYGYMSYMENESTILISSDYTSTINFPAEFGLSIRLVRDAVGSELLLPDGLTNIIYIGNNGQSYSVVKIDSLLYLQRSLSETLFNDLSPIPELQDNTSWSATADPARCKILIS